MSVFRRAGSLALLSLVSPLGAAVGIVLPRPSPAFAQDAPEGTEAAPRSNLAGVPLTGALRLTDARQRAEVRKQLDALAKQAGARRASDETLLWAGEHYGGPSAAARIMARVTDGLRAAGYEVQTQEAPATDGDRVTILIATKKAKKELLTGFWAAGQQALLLSWCRLEQSGADLDAVLSSPVAKPARPAPPVPTPAEPDTSPVLVPGKVPLTQRMVDHTCHFLAFLMETPLTEEQKAIIQKGIVDEWDRDPSLPANVRQMVSLREQIWARPEAERDFIRRRIQPGFLADLRKQKNDPSAKWMLAIYDAAHKPLAAGSPPLTRQMTDAYAEVLFFTASEAAGRKLTPDAATKSAMAKTLAAQWAKAPADFRAKLKQMPLYWAAVRVAWPQLPEEQKQGHRARWRRDMEKLAATHQAAQARTAAKAAGRARVASQRAPGRKKSFSEMMADQRRRHQTYMMFSRMSTEAHYSRMNSINTMGGNPYRYVNSYGVPY